MPLVVRAFPLRGSSSQLEAFAAALRGERAVEAAQFYRHYGITHESWHLQDTPQGPWVIAVSQIENPADAGARYAEATASFHAWFKNQVLSLTGIDPNTTPLGPPTHEVFSWSDAGHRALA
jgi:hypothetical protein